MLEKIRRSWRQLKASPPGRRFQERYERRHREGESGARKALTVGAGVVVLLAGLFFLPAPGPGFVVLALGAALLARESRRTARVLDGLELRGRELAGWARRRWERAGTLARAAAVLAALGLAGAGGWAAWTLLFG